MKKVMKRALPVVLVMVLAVCFMCVSAFADDDIIVIDDQIPTAVVDTEIVDIPEDDVPLADVPLADAPADTSADVVANAAVQQTGDSTMTWIAVAVLAVVAMVSVNVEVKRSEN